MESKEKLIYLGAGIRSRSLGLVVSIFLLVFLLLFGFSLFGVLTGTSQDLSIGGLKGTSSTTQCFGIGSLSNCTKTQDFGISPVIMIVGFLFVFVLLGFFGKRKEIVIENNKLTFVWGNVFLLRKKRIDISQIRSIRFYYLEKKLWSIFPYKVLALETYSTEGAFVFDTNIGFSKMDKAVTESFIKSLQKNILQTNPQVQYIEEFS